MCKFCSDKNARDTHLKRKSQTNDPTQKIINKES